MEKSSQPTQSKAGYERTKGILCQESYVYPGRQGIWALSALKGIHGGVSFHAAKKQGYICTAHISQLTLHNSQPYTGRCSWQSRKRYGVGTVRPRIYCG